MSDPINCQDVANLAKCFVAYDYPETKDLLKSALTLISSLLVFSVTFGEKIVGLQNSSKQALGHLVRAWIGFVLAIISGGLALTLIAMAAGTAIYSGIPFMGMPYTSLAIYSWNLILVMGALFIASLFSMVYAAIIAMRTRTLPPPQES